MGYVTHIPPLGCPPGCLPLCGQKNWYSMSSEVTEESCRRCVALTLDVPIEGWSREQWKQKVDEAIALAVSRRAEES